MLLQFSQDASSFATRISWLNFEPRSRSFLVKISRKGYFYFYYVEIRVLFFSFFYTGAFLLRGLRPNNVASSHPWCLIDFTIKKWQGFSHKKKTTEVVFFSFIINDYCAIPFALTQYPSGVVVFLKIAPDLLAQNQPPFTSNHSFADISPDALK